MSSKKQFDENTLQEHIRFLIVMRTENPEYDCHRARKNLLLCVCTDTYRFDYMSIDYRLNVLSTNYTMALRRALFSLKLDSNSIVMTNENVKINDAAYLFLSMMHHYVDFEFCSVPLDRALRRICLMHGQSVLKVKDRKAAAKDCNTIYKNLLRLQKCPWITNESDIMCANMTRGKYRDQRIMRTCMYYMLVRKFFSNKQKKYYGSSST